MKAHSRYLVAIALVVALAQIGFLSTMIIGRASILQDGTQVVLAVKPVDPRDLLRGDYVRLGYDISSVPIGIFEGVTSETGETGTKTVFVRLQKGADGLWLPVAARFGAPPSTPPGPDEADIRGMTYVVDVKNAKLIPVEYGIERFYLPEGEGEAIQNDLRERPFRMAIAIDGEGTPQIKGFYDGGKLIYSEPIY